MKIIERIELPLIRRHERQTKANVTLGGYKMDICCPVAEFKLMRCVLELDDIHRLFVLAEFSKHTNGECMVKAATAETIGNPRVASFAKDMVDLRKTAGLDLLIVSADASRSPLLIIDGNHRAIWQYLTYQSIHGVPAFVCSHPRINDWGYVPKVAKMI